VDHPGRLGHTTFIRSDHATTSRPCLQDHQPEWFRPEAGHQENVVLREQRSDVRDLAQVPRKRSSTHPTKETMKLGFLPGEWGADKRQFRIDTVLA
jgi:hypothetical protein